jgi:uncharacterized Zn-finger protein
MGVTGRAAFVLRPACGRHRARHRPAKILGWIIFRSLPMSRPSSEAPVLIPANAQMRYEVTLGDLPLSCPMPDMATWDSHPKVYLPIVEDGGQSICPYCGATYVLSD